MKCVLCTWAGAAIIAFGFLNSTGQDLGSSNHLFANSRPSRAGKTTVKRPARKRLAARTKRKPFRHKTNAPKVDAKAAAMPSVKSEVPDVPDQCRGKVDR